MTAVGLGPPLLTGPLFSADSARGKRFCVDTSTLIYLDRIGLLTLTCEVFSLATIPPVLTEFGRVVPQLRILPVVTAGASTDDALLAVVCQHQGVLLSEDGRLLRRAGRRGLCYYNSLMLICGLCHRGALGCREGGAYMEKLLAHARYSDVVLEYGRQVFAAVCPLSH